MAQDMGLCLQEAGKFFSPNKFQTHDYTEYLVGGWNHLASSLRTVSLHKRGALGSQQSADPAGQPVQPLRHASAQGAAQTSDTQMHHTNVSSVCFIRYLELQRPSLGFVLGNKTV